MITFQHHRDAAWFPVIVLPTGWFLVHWCNFSEIATGYGVDEYLFKIDHEPVPA